MRTMPEPYSPPLSDASPVLVVNAGSSSLKVKLLPQGHSFLVERIGGDAAAETSLNADIPTRDIADAQSALNTCLEVLSGVLELSTIAAVGHRVVHGGERYTDATRLTDDVIADLETLTPLAPLHNPANLAGIRAATALLPQAVHVAVFDTAFHSTLPPRAYLYGLPRRVLEQGVRRYGFHGTSHDFVTRRAAEILGRPRDTLKLVSLHLGNGASAAAVQGGESVDTTMGMTPLAGLLMGTRSGDVDPGALLYLLEQGTSASELDRVLNKESGLLGLSSVSNDMRDLHDAARAGNREAAEAIDVFCYRIRKTIGAYAAAMGGLDAVIFTGGIGENDAEVRAQVLQGVAFLGLELDPERNARGEQTISTPRSAAHILVVPTDEERMIAEATLEVAFR